MLDDLAHLSLQVVIENLFLHDRAQQAGIGGIRKLVKLSLKIAHLVHWKIIKGPTRARKDDQNLLREWQRRELLLLEYFDQPLSTIKLRLRGFVEIAAELRKCREFAVLREFQLHASGHLPHSLDLSAAAHAADRDTHVDRRAAHRY